MQLGKATYRLRDLIECSSFDSETVGIVHNLPSGQDGTQDDHCTTDIRNPSPNGGRVPKLSRNDEIGRHQLKARPLRRSVAAHIDTPFSGFGNRQRVGCKSSLVLAPQETAEIPCFSVSA